MDCLIHLNPSSPWIKLQPFGEIKHMCLWALIPLIFIPSPPIVEPGHRWHHAQTKQTLPKKRNSGQVFHLHLIKLIGISLPIQLF